MKTFVGAGRRRYAVGTPFLRRLMAGGKGGGTAYSRGPHAARLVDPSGVYREREATVYAQDSEHISMRRPVRLRWVKLADCAEPSGLAREEVRQLLAGHAPATCVDDAVLVASELVGNAVRHTAGGPDCLFVEVYRDTAVLRVHDAGMDADRVKACPVAASLDEPPEGGLGLRLVEELTVEWFVRPTAIGKVVVAILALDGGRTT